MSLFQSLDPLAPRAVEPTLTQGWRTVAGFTALFWAVLLVLPALVSGPWADADTALGVIEVYRRQWLVHGHPLQSSWLYGGGVLFRGLAQTPGWSPAVLLSLVFGPKIAALGWAWLQLSLGGGFAYGWARAEGATHRGAALASVLGWNSLWMVRHLVDGHLAWPALAWVLGFGWLMRARLPWRRTGLLALGLGLLLFSSSPLQAPFYGLPVLLLGLSRGRGASRWVAAAALGLAAVPTLGVVLDTFDAHQRYARGTTIALQDIKFLHGGSRPLRNLVGLVVPFASYGYHAEGNLLALIPLLVAAGRAPRRLLVGAALLLLIGLAPGFGGVRQLERTWWALILLACWHLAMNEGRLSSGLVQLSLGFTTAVSAAIVALRVLVSPGPLFPPATPGIGGLAVVEQSYLANDEVQGGVYASIRAGRVVHRPFTHVSLSEVPPARALVLSGPEGIRAQEGLLWLPSLEQGEVVVLALRPDARLWLEPVEGLEVGSEHGWLTLTALEAGTEITLRAR